MKTTLWPVRGRWGIPVLLLLPVGAWAYTKTLAVESTPPGATVYLDGKYVGNTPAKVAKVEFGRNDRREIIVSLEGYESATNWVTYDQGRALKGDVWVVPVFNLVPLRVSVAATITANAEAAGVSVNGRPVGSTPLNTPLEFLRPNGTAKWSDVTITVEKPPRFAAASQVVVGEEAVRAAGDAGPLRIDLKLGEIQRTVRVDVASSVPDAEVRLDLARVGRTPFSTNLLFSRASPNQKWPTVEFRVEKEGYEYAPRGKEPSPAFSQLVLADGPTNVAVNATDFMPLEYVRAPVRFFDIRTDQVRLTVTNLWSQISAGASDEKPTPMTSAPTNDPLVISRISVVPDEPDQFVYVRAIWEERAPAAGGLAGERQLIGSHIVKQQGAGTTPMTDEGRYYDLEPCVTRNWIYFSSDRTRQRIIWRVPLSGKGGYTPITGVHTRFDTEPAVSPDESRLAYVSRLPDSPPSTPSYIWIADAEGKLPTRYWAGRSPAWSPDAKRVAYVNMENRLCVAAVDGGGNPTQLAGGTFEVSWPCWVNDRLIAFSANQNDNGRKEKHFDIWLWDLDSNVSRALTTDGSLDASPATSSDGHFIYFFSNRGASRPGQEQVQVYRLPFSQGGSAN